MFLGLIGLRPNLQAVRVQEKRIWGLRLGAVGLSSKIGPSKPSKRPLNLRLALEEKRKMQLELESSGFRGFRVV